MAKGCVYIPKTGKDAGKVFGSKDSLAAHMNYTPALAEVMAKYQKADGKMDVGSVTKWLTDNGYIKAEVAKPTTNKAEPAKTAPTEKKPTTKKAFPKAPVTDVVKAALKSVDNTTAAIMNLAKVLPTVYESIARQVKLSLGKPASQQIAEAYHNAVENGVEPELVSAVENAVALQEQMKSKPSLSGQIETNETLEFQDVPTGTRAGNKASMDTLERKHSDNATKKAVIAAVKRAARTLKSVFPSMDIHVHEDSKQYEEAMAGLNGQKNSRGNFVYNTSSDGTTVGRIDINLSTATPRTVVHEVTHAILLKTFGDNSAAFLDFRKKIEKIISTSGNKRLSDFADQYEEIADEIGQAEEYLTELSAILSDKESPLNYGIVRKVAELINKAVSTVTFDRFQPFQDLQDQKDALEFFNTIAQSIKTGQEYSINDMGLHGEIKATGIKSKSSISSGEIMGFEVNPNTKVEEEVPLSRFNGKVTNLMESDRMVGGYIADEKGNPLFKFFGGVKFPEITGKWWASRTNSKAKGIAKNANSNRDADGYIYSSPMVGSEKQHMSNADMMFTTIELMKTDVKNKKSKVTKGDVVEIMNKTLKRKKIADKRDAFKSFFKAKNIVDMFEELEFILFQEGMEDPSAVKPAKGEKKEKEKKYLVDRNGNLMLTEEGKKKITVFSFEDRLKIVQTLLGDPKVKEPRFPMAGSITDTARRFTEPVAGRAEKIGDIVMVMRTKGTLKHEKTPTTDEFYHRSYPYEIYAVNEDGTPAKVEVFFLDGAYSMQDVLPELKKSNGDMFSYKEYAEKHAAKTATYVEAQYNRTAKLAYASGEISTDAETAIEEYEEAPASEKLVLKSKAQVAVFDETGYVSTEFWVKNLSANTKYLDAVIKSILDARSVLKKGKVRPEQVVKAYMITLGSMGSGGTYYDSWKEKTGQTVSNLFLEKEKGRDWLRPEGAAAAYLVTDEGKKLVDDMIAGTASAVQIKKLFDFIGVGRETQKASYAIKSMQNGGIKAMTDTFNENKGKDFAQLYQAAMDNLEGIGEGKTGFFNQYFGVSGRAVIDARELNAWIAGSMKLTPEQTKVKEKAASSKAIGDMLLKRIEEVGLKLGYSADMAGYIAHHAIWDAVKGSITTHEGEYTVVSGKPLPKSKPQLEDRPLTEIDGQTTFFHASSKKREGRLKANTAPQWGNAIYFAGNRKAATDEFGGDNVTEASLNLKKPAYTNTKEFREINEKATELYNREMLPNILKEEAELVNGKWNFFDEDLQAEYDKNGYIDRYTSDYIEEGRYFGDAAKELGYDAIIDEGGQYGTEIAVFDEDAVVYPEDIESDVVFSLESVKDSNIELKKQSIRGRLLNNQQAAELQTEIESNYTTSTNMFDRSKDDIRQKMFSYDEPYAEKNINGVNVRIAEGLIRTDKNGKREKTYLIYADGNVAGEFYSKNDALAVVKYIEDNLIKGLEPAISKGQLSLKSKAQILGLTGASRLDNAEKIMGNLEVAKKMERDFAKQPLTVGKRMSDAQKIKMATGWERGVDELWRLEIPDAKLKDFEISKLPKYMASQTRYARLGDVINAPELFKAYSVPRREGKQALEDVVVEFLDTTDFYGMFKEKQQVLQVSTNEKIHGNNDDMLSTILHEIQHYIQWVEGFEKGSTIVSLSGIPYVQLQIQKRAKGLFSAYNKLFDESNQPGADTQSINEDLRGIKFEYTKLKEEISKPVRDLYTRAAGEVEARNVQERMTLTQEERRGKLLLETEDVKRNDQLLLEEAVQTPSLKSKAQLADNNAKEVADLYAEMREGGGWTERQKINAILDRDPKLSYIYNNFKEITRMLEDAKLLTKSVNCP